MQDRRPLILGLNSVLIALSTIAIVARLFTRGFLIRGVGLDDVLVSIALILALAHSSLFMLSTRYGEGLYIQYLQPANVPVYTLVLTLEGLFYSLCQMFLKLSYLALYLRLSSDGTYRLILYVLIALVSAYGISTSIVSMLLCIPLEKSWKPDIPGSCINIYPFFISSSTLNIVLDLTIFILPIPILWRLHLPKRQRIGLACVFSLGLIVLVASVARLITLINLLSSPAFRRNNTWSTVNAIIWTVIEIHLGLLLSCTAAFKALIQRYLPGFLGSQEHIIDELEMPTFETTDSIRSPSKTSTDGGVLGGHPVAVVALT